MSKLTRHFSPGQSCFITNVTARREPILVQHTNLLAKAVRKAGSKFEFTVVAWVVLPDHFHFVLNTPNGDTSRIMQSIKLSFSGQYKSRTGCSGPIWQRRYWDHILRSQEDMNHHIDYIHCNPVKHGLVISPKDYGLSSFREYCRSDMYELNCRADINRFSDCKHGE